MSLNGYTALYLKDLDPPARRPFLENMDGVITLKNFSLSAGSLPLAIEGLNGKVTLEDNAVRLADASFKYRGTKFNIEAALTDLELDEPEGTFSLKSKELTSDGSFIFSEDYIKIKKITGKLLSSTYNIMGDINDIPSPTLNLYCETKINLADFAKLIGKLYPEYKYIYNSLKPEGQCAVAAFFNGGLKDTREAEGSIKLSSSKVSISGLAIDNVYLDLRMQDGLINTHRFNMNIYDGLFNGSFEMDLNEDQLPYSVGFSIKDIDLAKLSADTNFGKKKISGLVSSKFFLKADARSIDTMHGSGWITATNGLLWEMPLLGGVTDILGMPHLRSVAFEEAAGNFIVEDRKISTDDLTLYSDKVNITSTGYVDFDQNINLSLNTNINQEVVKSSSSDEWANIANLLITQAGSYMGKVKVTGTLKNPKYSLSRKPIEDMFKKEIKGLLKNILQ